MTRQVAVKAEQKQTARQDTKAARPAHAPARSAPALRQDLGNHTILRAYGDVIQAKLTLGTPGDSYEQEADRVAAAVLQLPERGVERQPGEGTGPLHAAPAASQVTPRSPGQARREDPVPAGAQPGPAPAATREIGALLESLRGDGHLLPEPTRLFFEPRFAFDFRQVHVHTGSRAAEAAQALNARAFSVGEDIVFGAGQYAPGESAGRKLIAHELAHVAQQRLGSRGPATPNVQRQPQGTARPALDAAQIESALFWYELHQGTALWRSEWVGPIAEKLARTAYRSVDARFVDLLARFQATAGGKTIDGTFDLQTRMRLLAKFPDLERVEGLAVCETGTSEVSKGLAQEREGEPIAPVKTESMAIQYAGPFGGDPVIAAYAAKLAAEYAARTPFKQALAGYRAREHSYAKYFTAEAGQKVTDPKLSRKARAEQVKQVAEQKLAQWRQEHPAPTAETHTAYSRDYYCDLLAFDFKKYTAMTIHRLIWQPAQAYRRSTLHLQLLAALPDDDLQQKIALAQYVIDLKLALTPDQEQQAAKLARSGVGARAIARAQRDAARELADTVGKQFAALLQGAEAQAPPAPNLGKTWRAIRQFVWESYGRIMAGGDNEAEKREALLRREKLLFRRTLRVPARGADGGLIEKMEALVYSETVLASLDEARKKAGEQLVAANLESIKTRYREWVTKNRKTLLQLKNAWMVMEREKLDFETKLQGLKYPRFGAPEELGELREIPAGISRNVTLKDVAGSLFVALRKQFKGHKEFVAYLAGVEEQEKAALLAEVTPLLQSRGDKKIVGEQVRKEIAAAMTKLTKAFNSGEEASGQTVEVPPRIVDQYTARMLRVRDTMIRMDVATFVAKLQEISAIPFTGSSYGGHGGGGVKGLGFSIDLFPKLAVDKRGFYDPDKTAQFFRFIHRAATETGCRWRAVYNDSLVANAINRELKEKYIAFVIWHGPQPYVLHIHLDVVPVQGET